MEFTAEEMWRHTSYHRGNRIEDLQQEIIDLNHTIEHLQVELSMHQKFTQALVKSSGNVEEAKREMNAFPEEKI